MKWILVLVLSLWVSSTVAASPSLYCRTALAEAKAQLLEEEANLARAKQAYLECIGQTKVKGDSHDVCAQALAPVYADYDAAVVFYRRVQAECAP